MQAGIHHALKRKRKVESTSSIQSVVDKLIYAFTIIGVLGNLPQLYKIWFDKNTSGVSLLTWLGFLVGSLFWLFYGVIHKEKPIIFANIMLASVQVLIVLGILFPNFHL